MNSCFQKPQMEENDAQYIIDINNPVRISIDDFITNIDTIRLEVTDESLLKDASIIRIMDDKFYILTNNRSGIFIFDLNGKFISNIKDRGQGPRDYLQITGFEVDPLNQRLILSDMQSSKILIYDKTGKQIEVINLNFRPNRILPFNNGFINMYIGYNKFYSNPDMENYLIHFLDSTGKFISSSIKSETTKPIHIYSDQQIKILDNGNVLFHPILGNIIYKITHDSIIPYYAFNNNSKYKMLTKKDKKNMELFLDVVNTFKYKENEGYLLSCGSVIELTDYSLFIFSGWDRARFLYYSKKTGKTLLIEPESIKGDKDFIKIFMSSPRVTHGNKLYISPSFFSPIQDICENMNNEKLKKYFENSDYNSNPFLISFSINFPE